MLTCGNQAHLLERMTRDVPLDPPQVGVLLGYEPRGGLVAALGVQKPPSLAVHTGGRAPCSFPGFSSVMDRRSGEAGTQSTERARVALGRGSGSEPDPWTALLLKLPARTHHRGRQNYLCLFCRARICFVNKEVSWPPRAPAKSGACSFQNKIQNKFWTNVKCLFVCLF